MFITLFIWARHFRQSVVTETDGGMFVPQLIAAALFCFVSGIRE
jgi:hypothetical protein